MKSRPHFSKGKASTRGLALTSEGKICTSTSSPPRKGGLVSGKCGLESTGKRSVHLEGERTSRELWMARSMLLMASTSMLKGRGQVEFLRGARGKRLCAVVPPSSRVQLQAGPLQSSKLVSDQLPELLAGGEQLLSIAGVNTRDPRISLAFSVATQASRKLEQGEGIVSTCPELSSAAPLSLLVVPFPF